MKRIILSLILALGFTFSIAPVAKADTVTFPCGGSATYSVLMPQGVLLDGKSCSGNLTIDNSVKIIDQAAFRQAQLTSVVIPNSVTHIGNMAFLQSQLSSVIIPSSVKTIGDQAFGWARLENVVLPDSVVSIGAYAFTKNPLTSINLPNSILKIGNNAFENTNLTSVTLPNSLTSINHCLFCGAKLISIVIPNSVTNIGPYSFSNNSQLISIVIPESVKTIENDAFNGDVSLSTISIPDNLQSLGERAFERNFSLSRIEYCGRLTGFPITPVCPPDRQKTINDKAAADKAAADILLSKMQARIKSTSAAFSQLDAEVDSLMKKYPSMKTELNLYKKKIALFDEINEKNIGTAELNLAGLTSKIVSIKATYIKIARSLTCIKGSKTVKVVDVKPVCPKGYKKK
jgi:hypothetical protein